MLFWPQWRQHIWVTGCRRPGLSVDAGEAEGEGEDEALEHGACV